MNGNVMKVPIGGGNPFVLASGPYGAQNIAIGGTSVYWTVAEQQGSVMRVGNGGGAAVTIASAQFVPTSLAVNATSAFWTTEANTLASVSLGGGNPVVLATDEWVAQTVAVSASFVYWVNGTGQIMQTPVGGGASTVFVSGQSPNLLAADAANLYWTDGAEGGSVKAKGLAGGDVVTLATAQAFPYGIAVGASAVFWVNITDGTIMKVAK